MVKLTDDMLIAGEILWDYLIDSGQCEINEGFDEMMKWLHSIEDIESPSTVNDDVKESRQTPSNPL